MEKGNIRIYEQEYIEFIINNKTFKKIIIEEIHYELVKYDNIYKYIILTNSEKEEYLEPCGIIDDHTFINFSSDNESIKLLVNGNLKIIKEIKNKVIINCGSKIEMKRMNIKFI
jgi:hypothetical protein